VLLLLAIGVEVISGIAKVTIFSRIFHILNATTKDTVIKR